MNFKLKHLVLLLFSMKPDLQPMLYCAAVAGDGDDNDIYNFVFDKYMDTAASTRQQTLLLNALACTTKTQNILE
jgi:hypothetical protein